MTQTATAILDTVTAIERRRAYKKFDPEFVMPAADEAELLRLARLSPTSFNTQNWRFLVVKDKALRAQIREAAWDQPHVTEASLLLVLCGDLKAFDREPYRYWRTAPPDVQAVKVPKLVDFYRGKPQLQRDEAMRSVGMAAQTVMLAAMAMGYESCPIIGFDPDRVATLIQLPQDFVIGMMVVVGKAIAPPNPRGGDVPEDEVLFEDRFPPVITPVNAGV